MRYLQSVLDLREIGVAVVGLLAASFVHFAHNAEYCAVYPNLPEWLTASAIWWAWSALTGVAVAGFSLWVAGFRKTALITFALYALSGFGGLEHYLLAPLSRHTWAMNLTIWAEVSAAALLLCGIVRSFRRGNGEPLSPPHRR